MKQNFGNKQWSTYEPLGPPPINRKPACNGCNSAGKPVAGPAASPAKIVEDARQHAVQSGAIAGGIMGTTVVDERDRRRKARKHRRAIAETLINVIFGPASNLRFLPKVRRLYETVARDLLDKVCDGPCWGFPVSTKTGESSVTQAVPGIGGTVAVGSPGAQHVVSLAEADAVANATENAEGIAYQNASLLCLGGSSLCFCENGTWANTTVAVVSTPTISGPGRVSGAIATATVVSVYNGGRCQR